MTPPDFVTAPIFELAKGNTKLVVGEREYKGARFLDIRDWAKDGQQATGKGATVPLEAVPDFARAVAAFAAEVATADGKRNKE